MKPVSATTRWLMLGMLWLGLLPTNPALAPATAVPRPAPEYRYTGEQIDPDLGMYYLRARYYQPGIGRFWNMDSYEGSQASPLSLHKYLYCHGNPVNGTDPTGHRYTQRFGYEAHRVIEAEYSLEHPGAIVGTPTGLYGTGLKPDILNNVGPNKTFAEIKPLSLSGAAHGYAQIIAYEAAFQIVDPAFKIDPWPGNVRTTRVFGQTVFYFNVCGVIFYTDEVLEAEELAGISTFAIARQFIRNNLLRQTFTAARNQIFSLAGTRGAVDGGRLEGMVGIATVISVMGGF